MFHTQKMRMTQPLAGLGLKLGQEKSKQKQQRAQLLVTQLDLDRQFKHGVNLVCAGVHANWLRLAFVKRLCKGACSRLTANGLELKQADKAAHYGALSTPRNRYPAHGSARVTPMKPNVGRNGRRSAAKGTKLRSSLASR